MLNVRPIYRCEDHPRCDGIIIANDDGSPKSIPSDDVTRNLRHQLHQIFDGLWKNRILGRDEAYGKLATLAGVPREMAHIGLLDAEQCQSLIDFLGGMETNRYRSQIDISRKFYDKHESRRQRNIDKLTRANSEISEYFGRRAA